MAIAVQTTATVIPALQYMDAPAATMRTYCIVPNPDAHLTRAQAAGAEIMREPETQDYGGRDCTCKDPKGHVWTFGTYDPWDHP
jgi:uncharacterized glyoxalase superfamily protein PhnB